METRLTEFSYGYCVTEELANGIGAGLKAAPYFPSLYAEGQAGGGFDVRIGSALFLQFKLCEQLTRGTALEAKEGLLTPTFFRFWLHRRDISNQHQLLIDLEAQPGNQVYYIAPGFADVDELNNAYVSGDVLSRSAMFSPADLGTLLDDKYHRVSFKPGDNFGWFLSDPKRVLKREMNAIRQSAFEHPSVNMNEARPWMEELGRNMAGIVRERQPWRRAALEVVLADKGPAKNPFERTAYLSRTFFGAEMFLAADPRS